MSLISVGDIQEFDHHLRTRLDSFSAKLDAWLEPHRLTLFEARTHKVLMPMVGVYTPGWQALPACSWAYVELVTNEGLVGTGEWSIDLPTQTSRCLEQLALEPRRNLLDRSLEGPLFMAWWDLVGQVLGRPLHVLWSDLFERGFDAPTEVPTAAYTWQRFPDRHGRNEVTFESWPEHARMRADQGFTAIKLSLTSYQPETNIELVQRVREAVGPAIRLRFDAHGTWNVPEARRMLRAVEDCDIELAEQPINALAPHRFRSGADHGKLARSSFQRDYYFRYMTQLRAEQSIPLSCHWWTPPIRHPRDAAVMDNRWEPDWDLMQRFDAADVSSPDIGLGPWGLWRIYELSRFMGMHRLLHSNFEMCLQLYFRSQLAAALMYDGDRAGLYLGATPRACHAIDNETVQVSDDVIVGGQFDWTGGHVQLTSAPGHGLRLDPERLAKYRYTEAAATPHRAYAQGIYANYLLDRPHTTTPAGWPKVAGPERWDGHAYPYRIDAILGARVESQEIDIELNKEMA